MTMNNLIFKIMSLPQCSHMTPTDVMEVIELVSIDDKEKIINVTKSVRKVFGDNPKASEGSMLVDAKDYDKLANTVNKLAEYYK